MSVPYSFKELQAVLIARDLKDGEQGAAGVGASVPMAAMLLAKHLHAPNLTIAGELFTNPVSRQLWESMLDDRSLGTCEATEGFEALFGHSHRGLDFFFHSGIQYDQYGNINLHVIGKDFYHPKFRGPGVANISYCHTSKRFYIYPSSHTKRNFVRKVDFITIPGNLQGPESKKCKGLTNEGPRFLISPRAVMDFDPVSLKMRLLSVHEGHTVQEVIENTGFDLIIPENVRLTISPTEEELYILRTAVDVTGLLRN